MGYEEWRRGRVGGHRRIGIHAVASNRNADERMWNIGHWAKLIMMLDGDVVFVGTEEDRKFYNRLYYLVGDISPRKMLDCTGYELIDVATLLHSFSCLVCINSGIMHIAIEFVPNLPIVAIVGGTPARIILPPNKENLRILEDPELKWWDEQAGHGPRVSRLNEIMPEQVLEKINEVV